MDRMFFDDPSLIGLNTSRLETHLGHDPKLVRGDRVLRTVREINPVMWLQSQMTGVMNSTNPLRGKATEGARALAYTTPAVFGMTSEKTRMERVKNAENMPIHSWPKTAVAAAPAMAAPAVFAMVFRLRMAVMGLSTFSLRSLKMRPAGRPDWARDST